MKAKILGAVGLVIAVLVLIVAASALYTVTEMQQAVVTQFGEVVRVVKEPGLHWKSPFVQKVNFLEKRIMEWDGYPTQVPTLGKKFIMVDTWARWRIVDPERFFISVRNETGGHAVLDDQIESAVRDAISSVRLEETVRSSSNRQFEYVTEEIEELHERPRRVEIGRDGLVEKVKEAAGKDLKENYGMELVDVQIKRLNYVERVRQDVYSRMQSERQRIAARYLSEARSKENEILGQMNRELDQIESEGYKEARIIKGKADADAARIYAEAYGKAPEFYSFLKTLETYQDTIDDHTVLLLTTDSAYFKYLRGELTSSGEPEGK